jgi:hypothetical protein
LADFRFNAGLPLKIFTGGDAMRTIHRPAIFALLLAATGLAGCNRGFSGWQVVRAASDEAPSANMKTVFANCPSGKKALGGGAVVGYQQGNNFPTDPNGILTESEPTGGYDGWQASAVDHTPGDEWAVIAYAVCAKVN